jgi:hypothetical protein
MLMLMPPTTAECTTGKIACAHAVNRPRTGPAAGAHLLPGGLTCRAMSGLGSLRRLRLRSLWRLVSIVALIVLTALALSGVVESLQGGAMMMLPALALAVVMLVRPYLGAGTIARLRARRAERPSVAAGVERPPRPRTRVARGGRLIAVALAGRAPPPSALVGCR